MRKLIVFVLVASILFTFASCVSGENKNSGNESDTITPQYTTAPTTNDDSNDIPTEDYDYIAFTASEDQMFRDLFGEVIPFIPNNEYSVEEYNTPSDHTTEKRIVFIAYGNTQEEFDAYREMFSHYAYSGIDTDSSGNTVYLYAPEDQSYTVMLSYYESEGRCVVKVDVFLEIKDETEGNKGVPYDKLFTNEGAGLPSDPDGDGVYDVDFTKGEYIKDITNQATYIDGCPPVGSPGVLIIPVQFKDATAESKGYTIDNIVEAFSKNGKTDYYSIYDYYYISSYGQLTLDITILDFWFTPEYDSEYYSQFSFVYENQEIMQGEQLILNEALDYLDDIMDLSQFDSDGNGTIDSVLLINTLDIDSSNMFYWAFRYFNFYKDESDSFYVYDGVHAKDYMWTPYLFIHEVCDDQGYPNYDNFNVMNTHTFLHEFGHVLGLEDYYSYTGIDFPLHGCDLMDSRNGDHNAYSKFNLGWITTSRLVVADEGITLTLEDYTKTGDTIIIANNWDDKLGAYQEYYVLVYYTINGLNVKDYNGYFDTEGILVYHVNAAMYMQEDKDHYDVYNNNTDVSHEYGTENNLIEYIPSASGSLIYGVGDTLPTVIDDYGNELIYSFTVDALTGEHATITFSVK